MTSSSNLDHLTPEQLRSLAAQLLSQVDTLERESHHDKTVIEQLTHEIAILKRHKFAKRSEQISPAQGSLLDDLLATDLETIEAELEALRPAPAATEPSLAVPAWRSRVRHLPSGRPGRRATAASGRRAAGSGAGPAGCPR